MKSPKSKNIITKYFKPSQFVLLIGVLLVLYSLNSLWQRYNATNQPSKSPDAYNTLTSTTDTPDETKPNENLKYDVPPDQPRRIILPTINSSGFVQKVGIDQKYAVAAPNNIHYGGWYVNSVKPGDKGLSIIDGHYGGYYSDGIFKNLSKLKIGDIYQVEFGDLSIKTFKVVDTMQIPEPESAEILLFKRSDITNQLNLITCGGAYDKSTKTYKDRQLIISTLL